MKLVVDKSIEILEVPQIFLPLGYHKKKSNFVDVSPTTHLPHLIKEVFEYPQKIIGWYLHPA